jgi:hypothetical protein
MLAACLHSLHLWLERKAAPAADGLFLLFVAGLRRASDGFLLRLTVEMPPRCEPCAGSLVLGESSLAFAA